MTARTGTPFPLSGDLIERALRAALAGGASFAELFFEYRTSCELHALNGSVNEVTHRVACGVGIRALRGTSCAYVCTGGAHEEDVLAASRHAGELSGRHGISAPLVRLRPRARAAAADGELAPPQRYADLASSADAAARAFDASVTGVDVTVAEDFQHVQIANTDGAHVIDTRPLFTLGVKAFARAGGTRAMGYVADGGRFGVPGFSEQRVAVTAQEAARIALVGCAGRKAPVGEMPVVIGAGDGGMVLHEAVGHGLEADFNRKGTSRYAGRLGQRVAPREVSVYDDHTVPGQRATAACDDEAAPTERTVLIGEGVLRGYLTDAAEARLAGTSSTGNGRRASYEVSPLPRMSNTALAAGEHGPDEILASCSRGVYIASFSGGRVDIATGNFALVSAEAYLIESGRKTAPLAPLTIVGNGEEMLRRVSMIGTDMRFAPCGYSCIKDDQKIPVGIGCPTFKVDALTIGGSAPSA